MKKIVIFNIFIFLFSFYLKAQQYSFNKQDSLFYNLNGEKCNGSFFESSNDFVDSTEIKFVEGKQIEIMSYYPNGKIMSISYFYSTGLTIGWFEDGTLKQFNFTKDGKIDGELKEWYNNKVLRSVTTYRNGVIEGESKSWHPNGKIAWIGNFCSNRQCGDTKEWFPSGILASESISNGIGKENSIREYHPNGVLFRQRILVNSLEWVWKIYDDNGKLIREEFFKNGMLKETKIY